MIEAGAILKGIASIGCFAGSYYIYNSFPEQRFRRVLVRVIKAKGIVQEERKPDGKRIFVYPKIMRVYEEKFGFSANIRLPSGITFSEFKKFKEAFENATNSEVHMEAEGKYVIMFFYMMPLQRQMNFHEGLLESLDGLQFPLGYSKRGVENHTFDDELGAHMLISGAPGTGKSILLRLLITCLLIRLKQNVKMYLINNKLVDNYPFLGIPNVEIVESADIAKMVIVHILGMIHQRKKQLMQKGYDRVSEWNKKEDEPMHPYFVIIDEFARFSDDNDFQKLIVEVGELGRFAGVHLVIATQRADGREVISPRLKDVCLTKVCFKVGTEGGSKIILGNTMAYDLPLIPGRAVVYTNHFRTIQVPFMSKEQCLELLKDLKQEGIKLYEFNNEGQSDLGEFEPLRANEPKANRKNSLRRLQSSTR